MYSSFANPELLSLVLGCFTYGACRNDTANYVSGLPTPQGISWLLGWGWPVPGWLEHELSAMLTWQHDFWKDTACIRSGRSMGRGRKLSALIQGDKSWDAAHWHLATLCKPTGWPVWTTGLWAMCDCCIWWAHWTAQLQLEVTPQFQQKWWISHTDIPVTDGNRPKKDNFNINQEWNPWQLEDWSRILLHTVECKLFYLIISKSLSASVFPVANSSIYLSRNRRKKIITCSNHASFSVSCVIVIHKR